jgi:SAM-dependent methyltransferase
VDFYVRLASAHASVLEYGIGNGRIALPIVRASRRTSVWGIDHSREMVADLRAQLRREPEDVRRRVVARVGDMRAVRLGRRFPLVICPFNTALHLYTRRDMERWLARVNEHLTPRGELVFDVSMPILEDLARDPGRAYRTPPFLHPTAGKVNYREHFDYDRVRQILFVSMFFEPANGGRRETSPEFMTPLAHRQFFPRELEALLHYNGFETTDVYGDFRGGPLEGRSDVMVWRARPRRKA